MLPNRVGRTSCDLAFQLARIDAVQAWIAAGIGSPQVASALMPGV
jgi:hypothetical protein